MADAGSARVEIQPSANRFNAHLKSQEALLTCQEVSINYGTLTRWTQYVCRYVSVRYDVTFFSADARDWMPLPQESSAIRTCYFAMAS